MSIHVKPQTEGGPNPPALEPEAPNERCLDCGLELEQHHGQACMGHQLCLPECPRCGGELVSI